MKKILIGLAALPFLAGIASAADRLSDAQMDRVTAGALTLPIITIDCPVCISASSGQTSTTTNGVTIVTILGGGSSSSSSSNGGSSSQPTTPPQLVFGGNGLQVQK